jgi:MarR family transcriptional regulator, transcriptional regulator for hemolysin
MISDQSVSNGDPPGDGVAAAAPFHPLGRHLVFTAKAIRDAFEDMLRASGGSLGTWAVLNAVSEQGSVSQKDLAAHSHLEGATITHHIDRLEQLGLVRRLVDPADRRVRKIEATPEGVDLHKQLVAAARDFERTVFAGVTDAERETLRRALDRIDSNLLLLEG